MLALVVGALLWLATGFYIVDEGNAASCNVLANTSRPPSPDRAGISRGRSSPAPSSILNQVRSVEVGFRGASRNRDAKQAQMLTEDPQHHRYRLRRAIHAVGRRAFLFNHRKPEEAVVQAAETAMREVVGKRKMDFLLNQGREGIRRCHPKLMQQLLDRYGTGITISKLNLQAVAAPEAVNEAFQDVVKAQQYREQQVNEGQAYANRVIPRHAAVRHVCWKKRPATNRAWLPAPRVMPRASLRSSANTTRPRWSLASASTST